MTMLARHRWWRSEPHARGNSYVPDALAAGSLNHRGKRNPENPGSHAATSAHARRERPYPIRVTRLHFRRAHDQRQRHQVTAPGQVRSASNHGQGRSGVLRGRELVLQRDRLRLLQVEVANTCLPGPRELPDAAWCCQCRGAKESAPPLARTPAGELAPNNCAASRKGRCGVPAAYLTGHSLCSMHDVKGMSGLM